MKIITGLFLQATEADTLAQMLNEDTSMSFFEILMQGGALMFPLFILSVLAIYVIAERWRKLENSKMDIAAMLNNIESLAEVWQPAACHSVLRGVRQTSCPYTQIRNQPSGTAYSRYRRGDSQCREKRDLLS